MSDDVRDYLTICNGVPRKKPDSFIVSITVIKLIAKTAILVIRVTSYDLMATQVIISIVIQVNFKKGKLSWRKKTIIT